MTDKLWSEIKHFVVGEFDSPDDAGSGIKMNIELVKLLDRIRDDCKFPFIINSGFRTPEHNKRVGGVAGSAHEMGLACDIRTDSSSDRFAILKAAFKLGVARVGLGKDFIHIDIDYSKPQNVAWPYPCGCVKK